MKKLFSISSAIFFIAALTLSGLAFAHEGAHQDDDHGKGKQHHRKSEEGSGTYGSEYSGHHEGKKYGDHGKYKGEHKGEGSEGEAAHERKREHGMEEGSGKGIQQKSQTREHKQEGS